MQINTKFWGGERVLSTQMREPLEQEIQRMEPDNGTMLSQHCKHPYSTNRFIRKQLAMLKVNTVTWCKSLKKQGGSQGTMDFI